MDTGACQATVHGVTKSQTQLSDWHKQDKLVLIQEFSSRTGMKLSAHSTNASFLSLDHLAPWPWWLRVKNPPAVQEISCNARDPGSILELKRSPEEGNGNPLQCSGLGDPMDTAAWWATIHGVAGVRHGLATKPPPHKQQLLLQRPSLSSLWGVSSPHTPHSLWAAPGWTKSSNRLYPWINNCATVQQILKI